MDTPQITRQSYLMIATLGFVWGGTFLVMEIALRGITPFWLAAARISSAALITSLIVLARGKPLYQNPTGPREIPTLLLVGLLSSAVPFMFLSWGQQYVTSGFAGVSMAAVALMVLPLAHLLIPGEGLTLPKIIGFLIGFVGVVVLIGAQAFDTTGSAREPWGRAACFAAAACYALSSVLIRRLPPVDPIALSARLLTIGAAVVLPIAYLVEGPPVMPDNTTLIVLAYLGLIPTAAANLLRVLVIRSAGPGFMTLTSYQVPLWSVFLGALILNESLPPSLFIALGLILGGMAISQSHLWFMRRR